MKQLFAKLFPKPSRHREHPRATHARLYGVDVDIDKVWEDRDAMHEASRVFASDLERG